MKNKLKPEKAKFSPKENHRQGERKSSAKESGSLDKKKPSAGKSKPKFEKDRKDNQLIFGRNAVSEFLDSHQILKILVKSGKKDQRLLDLIDHGISEKISIEEISEEKLERMAKGIAHQGVAAYLKPYEFADLNKVLEQWEGKSPVLVLLDGLEDVRNLGAIVRTSECAGVAAVLLPKHKSPPVTAAAMKTAAGAFAHLPVCEIGNIRQTLEALKDKGFWVVGADMDGESLYYEANMKGSLVIVMGAEGKGVSSLTKKMCDFLVRIPMVGKVSSLNVSVAAALLIYEAMKQRNKS